MNRRELQAQVNKTLRTFFLKNTKDYKTILHDIKSLEIQGANNIAFYGLVALYDFFRSHKEGFSFHPFIKKLYSFRQKLFDTRPTEPKLHNVVDYCILHLFDTKKAVSYKVLYDHFYANLKEIIEEMLIQKDKIITNGIKVIHKQDIIYTHCHSSSVLGIIKSAHKKGKNISVHNTETRPRFQGRLTAKELLQAGVPVTHYPDMGLRYALEHASIALIGCDSIDQNGIYNKIGSAIIGESASDMDVPLYVCTSSLKFNFNCLFGKCTVVEERNCDEVWDYTHKFLTVKNYAFEKVEPEHITGVISDLGVLPFKEFITQVIKKYNRKND